MNSINLNQNIDVESLITHLQREANEGDREAIKTGKARIHSHAERIEDKRQEQLDNIRERLKGASPNGCLKFFSSIFKVFDLLLKPISAVTGGQLKLELSQAFEMLKKAQVTGKLFGLKIDGEEISGALQDLKQLLQEDMRRMDDQQDASHKQNQQVVKILENMQQSFESTVQS
ncbi:MAG: hypothetical protein R3351_08130 [Nitrospirales bacterium]|nr:hypothetical protein [Nitrospirales bacterium]